MLSEISKEERDELLNEEHLRLLSIGHYVMGGTLIGFATLFLFHFFIFLVFAQRPELLGGPSNSHTPPAGVMMIFPIIFGGIILAGWTFGGLTIYAGRCIKRRVRRTLTLVVACLHTLSVPFGTVLGVFTLMVLTRPGVQRLYGQPAPLDHPNP